MNPTSRAKLGLDVARTTTLAEAMSEEDPERRRALYGRLPADVTAVLDPGPEE